MTYLRLKKLFGDLRFLFGLYMLICLAVSIHKYFCGPTNYITFATSFWELIKGVDIYFPVPKIWDYKYSPSFSVLFGPMAILPLFLGVIVWNAINAIVLYVAVTRLRIEQKAKVFILWFLVFEYITSLQNFQSNILIAGLILITFNLLEDQKQLSAAFFTLLSIFIKIFGAACGLLFVFYPKKLKFILFGLLWTVVISLLPLLFVSPSWLLHLYQSWYKTMSTDFSGSLGYSEMMLINRLVPVSKTYIQLTGLAILILPLIISYAKFKEYKNRLVYTASIMIWIIIFNHKAESSTFIIAATGVAIWYVNSKKSILDKILMIGVFIFTTLTYTDLPSKIFVKLADLEIIKTLPCVFVWIKIQFDLLRKDTH